MWMPFTSQWTTSDWFWHHGRMRQLVISEFVSLDGVMVEQETHGNGIVKRVLDVVR